MTGVARVWLTDNELAQLLTWFGVLEFEGVNQADDDDLFYKLEAVREEVACRVPGAGRTLARDVE